MSQDSSEGRLTRDRLLTGGGAALIGSVIAAGVAAEPATAAPTPTKDDFLVYDGLTYSPLPLGIVNVKNYGAKGDGVADDTAALTAALTAGAGKTVFAPPGTYKLTGNFTLAVNTRLVLSAGTNLSISTAGGDVFSLAVGAGIVGEGWGGPAAQILLQAPASVARVITNADKTGGQEYVYVEGVHIRALPGAACSVAAVDLVSVFANSFVRDLFVDCAGRITTGLRIAAGSGGGSGGAGLGWITCDHVTVWNGAGHNVVVEESAAGAPTVAFDALDSEGQASGFAALYVKGLAGRGFSRVVVQRFHYENYVAATAVTPAVWCDGPADFIVILAGDLLAGPVTNKRGIWLNGPTRVTLRDICNHVNAPYIDPILRDDQALSPSGTTPFLIGSSGIAEYVTGADATGYIRVNSDNEFYLGSKPHARRIVATAGPDTFHFMASNDDWADVKGKRLLAAGGIGVGNALAASALGSVVKKVQVFDSNGNSLGYVPIYDAIS